MNGQINAPALSASERLAIRNRCLMNGQLLEDRFLDEFELALLARVDAVRDQAVKPLFATVMMDNSGEQPVYCLMAAWQKKADALAALETVGGALKGTPAAAVADAQPDLRNALDTLVREAQAVADDYHRPRYTRLDEAIRWARLALSALQPSSNPGPLAAVEETAALVRWNPMDTAPRDGTIVQLLVEFDEGNIHDADEPQATIGTNTFDDSGIDEWRFAGWSWCHDCWIEGTGKPIGWLPFHNPIAASTAGEQERT